MPHRESEKPDRRDLFRGALEMMILRSLEREPMHGYALVQHIKKRSNDRLLVEEGSLYPALQRLLKERLLKAEWEMSASNRRVRTYHITPAGKKHLAREMSSFEQMLQAVALVLSPEH
jgi:transcriptional regulator